MNRTRCCKKCSAEKYVRKRITLTWHSYVTVSPTVYITAICLANWSPPAPSTLAVSSIASVWTTTPWAHIIAWLRQQYCLRTAAIYNSEFVNLSDQEKEAWCSAKSAEMQVRRNVGPISVDWSLVPDKTPISMPNYVRLGIEFELQIWKLSGREDSQGKLISAFSFPSN